VPSLDQNGSVRAIVPAHRREWIASRLMADGSITVQEVEAEFGVSPMTARRDLGILEREGRAHRTHGGAVAPTLARHEDSFAARLEQASGAKLRLAGAASRFVDDGEAVFVDSSTTAYMAVRELLTAGRRRLVPGRAVRSAYTDDAARPHSVQRIGHRAHRTQCVDQPAGPAVAGVHHAAHRDRHLTDAVRRQHRELPRGERRQRADVVLQLQSNWMADYRNGSGIVVDDGPHGTTIAIEDSSRVDPWIVRQAQREAESCRQRLAEFSRRDHPTADG